jgi:hypothetical protein
MGILTPQVSVIRAAAVAFVGPRPTQMPLVCAVAMTAIVTNRFRDSGLVSNR